MFAASASGIPARPSLSQPVPSIGKNREESGRIGTIVQRTPQSHSGDLLVARMVAELVEVKPGVEKCDRIQFGHGTDAMNRVSTKNLSDRNVETLINGAHLRHSRHSCWEPKRPVPSLLGKL